ncbi:MAG TPA: ABC transporter permease [Anaerolineales bacterium]|nr:ABC transporter permease [Anaerolineales bacterium]
MRILDLALKDLSQMLRDKRSMVFIVAMPIIFTLFMGFAYRGSTQSDENADNRIPLALVDPEPESRLNKMLFTRLDSSDSIRIVPMNEDEAMDAFHKGEVAGVLVIPVGFSEQAEVGREAAAQLNLIAEAGSSAGQSLYQSLRVPISQLMSAVEVARLSAAVQSNADEYVPSLELAWSKWDENSKLSLVHVEQAVAEQAESDWTGGNPYNQASPGILVQFAIFGLITSAQILVQERKTRTLQRLMTTAMKPWEIVAGHLLAMFALTFLQTAMLVIFGQLALGVDYLREPIGTLLVSIMLGLWVASMGLLIGVIAKSDDQVILYSMIAMFLFSALGGTWFPLEAAGGAFGAIGRTLPSAWAMNGYQNILIRGLGLGSAWMPAMILFVYALGFFGLAVWRFRKMDV